MTIRVSTRLHRSLLLITLVGCTASPPLELLEKARLAEPPAIISIEIQNYTPTSGRVFRDIFVSNFSAKVNRGLLEYSTARDGLTDAAKKRLEPRYGFSVSVPDWNGDGFGDLLMLQAGIPADKQASLYCGTQQRQASANDAFTYNDRRIAGSPAQFLGLRDCEKSFLQLKPTSFDFDGDGIPDYLEVRAGLNPKNPYDSSLDISNDGLTNMEKVKRNIPVDEDARLQPNQTYAYEYSSDFDINGTRTFRIRNIPVINGGIENFIAIYIIENDPLTRRDHLYSAFLVLDRAMAGQNIQIAFWGNDPSASQTNQEILE